MEPQLLALSRRLHHCVPADPSISSCFPSRGQQRDWVEAKSRIHVDHGNAVGKWGWRRLGFTHSFNHSSNTYLLNVYSVPCVFVLGSGAL